VQSYNKGWVGTIMLTTCATSWMGMAMGLTCVLCRVCNRVPMLLQQGIADPRIVVRLGNRTLTSQPHAAESCFRVSLTEQSASPKRVNYFLSSRRCSFGSAKVYYIILLYCFASHCFPFPRSKHARLRSYIVPIIVYIFITYTYTYSNTNTNIHTYTSFLNGRSPSACARNRLRRVPRCDSTHGQEKRRQRRGLEKWGTRI